MLVHRDEDSTFLCVTVDGIVGKKVQWKVENYASEAVANKEFADA